MSDIPTLNYSTQITSGGWDGVPEGKSRVIVKEDDNIIFCETVSEFDAKRTLDAFIEKQGWMTFEEWNRLYPLRYKMWVDEDERDWDSTFCDQVCTDRLTGLEVFRYDLGDPANTNSEYGGYSNEERFERRGLKRGERARLEECVVKD